MQECDKDKYHIYFCLLCAARWQEARTRACREPALRRRSPHRRASRRRSAPAHRPTSARRRRHDPPAGGFTRRRAASAPAAGRFGTPPSGSARRELQRSGSSFGPSSAFSPYGGAGHRDGGASGARLAAAALAVLLLSVDLM